MPKHWLLKSEPGAYAFETLRKERRTAWTGIRNYEARNNLRAMSPGDVCLYYHTGDEKAVVGLCRVVSAPGPDPTAPREDWASVEIAADKPLPSPVTLAAIKKTKALAGFGLVKKPRISVIPVTPGEYAAILKLAKKKA